MNLNVSLLLTNDDGHQIQTVETIHLGNVTERNESRAAVVQNHQAHVHSRESTEIVSNGNGGRTHFSHKSHFGCYYVLASNDFHVHFPPMSTN